MKNVKFLAPAFAAAIVCVFAGCRFREAAAFDIEAEGGQFALTAHSKKAAAGIFPLSAKGEYIYTFDTQLDVPQNSSLEIEYSITDTAETPSEGMQAEAQVSVQVDESTVWLLPLSLDFLRAKEAPQKLRYSIPLENKDIKKITVKTDGVKNTNSVCIKKLYISPRYFGFAASADSFALSPFIKYDDTPPNAASYLISVPDAYKIDGRVFVRLFGASSGSRIECNSRSFSYIASPPLGEAAFAGFPLSLPSAITGKDPFPVRLTGETNALMVLASLPQDFPAEPRTADPYFVLTFPQISWRDERYEVFCWESFPSILIFDTSKYDVQDRLFKRLAFFAEKKGYRGRLVPDNEIAELRGWNAHDYNAETLAAFFNLVKKQNFPITREEEELRGILTANGIIKESGEGILPGMGAVISISREPNGYLRSLFMTHEGFHGIFFIDAEFRAFCEERWNKLDRVSKRFILSYFDYQQYDIKDTYLIVNEFMAHIMQQSAGAAAEYFGKTIAGRLETSDWRRSVLPEKDEASGTYPSLAAAFDAEARAFSDYARRRWGLDCGRVWRVSAAP